MGGVGSKIVPNSGQACAISESKADIKVRRSSASRCPGHDSAMAHDSKTLLLMRRTKILMALKSSIGHNAISVDLDPEQRQLLVELLEQSERREAAAAAASITGVPEPLASDRISSGNCAGSKNDPPVMTTTTTTTAQLKSKRPRMSSVFTEDPDQALLYEDFMPPLEYEPRGMSLNHMGEHHDYWERILLTMKLKNRVAEWKGQSSRRRLPSEQEEDNEAALLTLALEKFDSWSEFDVFGVDQICAGLPLQTVALNAFARLGTLERFGLSEGKLRSFLADVEAHHHAKNPYHTAMHVSDVVQAVVVALRADEGWQALTDLEVLSLLLAATIHDVDHPGLNNPFLVKTQTEKALLYNDRSVLENGHASLGLRLLRKEENNFVERLSDEDQAFVRRLVISLVLATDMAFHADLHDEFDASSARLGGNIPDWTGPDRVTLLKSLLHACDISNLGRPFPRCAEWGRRITLEFFLQGDREREAGLPVMPLNDRATAHGVRNQQVFCDIFVKSTFKQLEVVSPKFASEVLANAVLNSEEYGRMIGEGRVQFSLPVPEELS